MNNKTEELFQKALTAAAKSKARASKPAPWNPTAREFAEAVKVKLALFMHNQLNASQGMRLGSEDTVMITYASVARGSSEIDCLNAQTTAKIMVSSAKGLPWSSDAPMPAKVKIEMFAGSVRTAKDWKPEHKVKPLRQKTGTPIQILEHLSQYFHDNQKAFLP